MKQISAYSDYTVIREWTNEEIEKKFSDKEKESFKQYNNTCPECNHELSIIISNGQLGTGYVLICTYCHTEYNITDYDIW